jgi:replicative DNA helicase
MRGIHPLDADDAAPVRDLPGEAGEAVVSIRSAVKSFRTDLSERQSNPSPVWGLPTGFRSYDLKTGGLHPKEVTVWAGRTGMGKTAAVLQAIGNVCDTLVHTRDPRVVLFFSAEMSAEEIVRRIAAQRLSLSVADMMKGNLRRRTTSAWTPSSRASRTGRWRSTTRSVPSWATSPVRPRTWSGRGDPPTVRAPSRCSR